MLHPVGERAPYLRGHGGVFLPLNSQGGRSRSLTPIVRGDYKLETHYLFQFINWL